jgi:hypothetical protein
MPNNPGRVEPSGTETDDPRRREGERQRHDDNGTDRPIRPSDFSKVPTLGRGRILAGGGGVLPVHGGGRRAPLYRVYQAQWEFSATTLTAVYAGYVLVLGHRPGVRPSIVGDEDTRRDRGEVDVVHARGQQLDEPQLVVVRELPAGSSWPGRQPISASARRRVSSCSDGC